MVREQCLIVFARQPVAGQVKSRLARDVGAERAARLYRAFLEDALRTCLEVEDAELEVAFTPPEAAAEFRALAPRVRCFPQCAGDLGQRMHSAVEGALSRGSRRIVIVGSDTPHLPAERLREGLARLASHPLVLGPSADGGFYLLGLRAAREELFRGVEWGSERVLAQTLSNARSLGWTAQLLREEFDVDTLADLERLRELGRAGPAATWIRTAALLAE